MLVDMELNLIVILTGISLFSYTLPDLMHRGHLTKIRDLRRRPEMMLIFYLRLNKAKRIVGFLN